MLLAIAPEARVVLDRAAALDRCLDAAGRSVTDMVDPDRVCRAIESGLDGDRAALRTIGAVPAPVSARPPPWVATAGFLAVMGLIGYLAGDPDLLTRQAGSTMSQAPIVLESVLIWWMP